MRTWPLRFSGAYLGVLAVMRLMFVSEEPASPALPEPAGDVLAVMADPKMLAVLEGPPPARPGLDVAELGRLLRLPRRQELPSDPTPAATVASAPVELRVCQLGPGAYEIETPDRLDDIDHACETAMQARIVPAFKDGVAIGFKLFSIRPGSLYAQLGVVNGDVIRRINGFDLTSPEKALELYSKMKQTTHFELMLEREGRLLTQTYELIKPPREGWRCRPSTSASGR